MDYFFLCLIEKVSGFKLPFTSTLISKTKQIVASFSLKILDQTVLIFSLWA